MDQMWKWVKTYRHWVLSGLAVVAVAILALIFIPKMQVPVCPTEKEALAAKLCFDIENEARKTLAYIMGGVLAIIGITLAFRRIRALERQVQVAQEGQITERFTRAIEQLGSDRMEVRLGGIYALERIANDSDKDYWPIMETLTAYVRERAPWREVPPETPAEADREEAAGEEAAAPEETASPALADAPKPATDIQAILTVLGRRKYRNGTLDLRRTDLRGADLRWANLEGAFLMEAHLEGSNLYMAKLEFAMLWDSHLEKADLVGADLKAAILLRTHLEGANLTSACLNGTLFAVVHLEGATGLTREQLAEAILDEKTILPDYLQEQPREDSGPEGNSEE